jgi:hypothetical protein
MKIMKLVMVISFLVLFSTTVEALPSHSSQEWNGCWYDISGAWGNIYFTITNEQTFHADFTGSPEWPEGTIDGSIRDDQQNWIVNGEYSNSKQHDIITFEFNHYYLNTVAPVDFFQLDQSGNRISQTASWKRCTPI